MKGEPTLSEHISLQHWLCVPTFGTGHVRMPLWAWIYNSVILTYDEEIHSKQIKVTLYSNNRESLHEQNFKSSKMRLGVVESLNGQLNSLAWTYAIFLLVKIKHIKCLFAHLVIRTQQSCLPSAAIDYLTIKSGMYKNIIWKYE